MWTLGAFCHCLCEKTEQQIFVAHSLALLYSKNGLGRAAANPIA